MRAQLSETLAFVCGVLVTALWVFLIGACLVLFAVSKGWAGDRDGGAVVGGRPAGCPHRFCGCEASLFKFGKIIPSLNLAASWLRFPKTQPSPGMAAVRRGGGHVFILLNHVEGKDWLVHDGNSGGGKTREHVRSIAGFIVVNPNQKVAVQ
jgi:hypothetical protein